MGAQAGWSRLSVVPAAATKRRPSGSDRAAWSPARGRGCPRRRPRSGPTPRPRRTTRADRRGRDRTRARRAGVARPRGGPRPAGPSPGRGARGRGRAQNSTEDSRPASCSVNVHQAQHAGDRDGEQRGPLVRKDTRIPMTPRREGSPDHREGDRAVLKVEVRIPKCHAVLGAQLQGRGPPAEHIARGIKPLSPGCPHHDRDPRTCPRRLSIPNAARILR